MGDVIFCALRVRDFGARILDKESASVLSTISRLLFYEPEGRRFSTRSSAFCRAAKASSTEMSRQESHRSETTLKCGTPSQRRSPGIHTVRV
jgi:hypothetical protein